MYTIISPSKTQDFSRNFPKGENFARVSQYNLQTKQLAKVMKKLSAGEIENVMHVSKKIGQLNHDRFQKWNGGYKERKKGHNGEYNFSPAIYAFMGDVYRGFDLDMYGKRDHSFAQEHLGIVSGFYGLLAPLTYMQPYRLEMGTRMSFEINNKDYKNLYAFWQEELTRRMNEILQQETTLLNLASVEYAKVLDRKQLNWEVIDVDFKIKKDGKVRIIAIYAKRARGLMANWIIQERINKLEDLKDFHCDGWRYSSKESKLNKLVFIKRNL